MFRRTLWRSGEEPDPLRNSARGVTQRNLAPLLARATQDAGTDPMEHSSEAEDTEPEEEAGEEHRAFVSSSSPRRHVES